LEECCRNEQTIMINFNDLRPVVPGVKDTYSFVGIHKRGNEIQFRLPKGFKPTDFDSYDRKRDLFFLLYKVLRQFKSICIDKGYDRDGAIQNKGSKQTITLPDATDDDESILYSKLDNISAIIDLYDELKILSLSHRLGTSEKVDYSKIHKYLHACTYLSNGAAYVDVMTLPRQQVLYQATDIVGMYCYILSQIKQQLHEEIGSEVQTLADDFSHRYIGAEYSLFNEEYCTLTVDILKDYLEVIEHNTPLKDIDYWQLHDAIELFLYGELSNQDEGEVWGISNFHSVWESMCLTYLVKTVDAERMLHVDTTYLAIDVIAQWKSKPKVIDINGVFTINERRLVPDAVIFPNVFGDVGEVTNFIMRPHYWDDSGFTTSFTPESNYFDEFYKKSGYKKGQFKIGYIGQLPSTFHTFEELAKTYGDRGNDIVISSKLSSKFYSYWNLDVLCRYDKETLALMEKLNHIFYLAIKSNVYTVDGLLNFLDDKRYFGDTGCVTTSVLRLGGESRFYKEETLEQFGNFLRATVTPFNTPFNIIDIKYFDFADFADNDFDSRHFKEKSIRKQFVYEYLLQQHLDTMDRFKDIEIKSRFMLPCWRNNKQNGTKKISTYLTIYIDLLLFNFSAIADHYFD
jgi:hypothetical protein